jgi:cytochrome c553
MDARFRFVAGFVGVLNTLLIILLCGVTMETREEVKGLHEVLATKQDLVNVAAPKLTLFTEEKCTTCHAERRFLGPHNVRGEIEQAVAHMQALPDTNFTDEDLAKIHASLALLRCTRCHGADRMRTLAIKSPEQRMQIIREMIAKPGSNISPDEAEEISNSLEQLLGF